MAYKDDIDALNPEHRWDFDGDSLDQVGSVNGTDTGISYASAGLCKGVTNCAETDAIGDRIALATTTDINNSAMARHSVCGWFMATAIQTPPRRIYGEGTHLTGFQLILAYGNTLMFEVAEPTNFNLQAIAGTPLVPNRTYHIFATYEGSGYGNLIKLLVDGVEQTLTVPDPPQPNTADLNSRGVAEFGDPATSSTGVGEQSLTMSAGINFRYNEWASWGDTANAIISVANVRLELFEKGVLGDVTISAGTEAAMQISLDALADTVRGDAPCCIEIEAVTGDGDVELTADNITFNALASIHIKYLGTGKLTWINSNGADASIGSAPFGTFEIQNPSTLTIDGLINGSEVRIYDDDGVDSNDFGTELTGIETLSGTSFNYEHAGSTNDIVIQMIATGYKEIKLRRTLSASNQIVTVLPIVDTNI